MIKIRKGTLQHLSKVCQIYKNDETRGHIDGIVNLEITANETAKIVATDGYTMLVQTIGIDAETLENIQTNCIKLDNGTYSLKFAKYSCKKSEQNELITIHETNDYTCCSRDYVKYAAVIPSAQKRQALEQIAMTSYTYGKFAKLLKLLEVKKYVMTFHGTTAPMIVTSEQFQGLIVVMPAKL